MYRTTIINTVDSGIILRNASVCICASLKLVCNALTQSACPPSQSAVRQLTLISSYYLSLLCHKQPYSKKINSSIVPLIVISENVQSVSIKPHYHYHFQTILRLEKDGSLGVQKQEW